MPLTFSVTPSCTLRSIACASQGELFHSQGTLVLDVEKPEETPGFVHIQAEQLQPGTNALVL